MSNREARGREFERIIKALLLRCVVDVVQTVAL